MIQKVEQILKDLITGKIQVKLNLHEPDSFETSQTFHEDIIIDLPDDECITCEFDWSYTREKGKKSSDNLTPNDPDTLTLNYLNINSLDHLNMKSCIFYKNGDEYDINKQSRLKGYMLEFLSEEIPTDEISKRIYNQINFLKMDDWKNHLNKMKENKILKFEEFVNENKVEYPIKVEVCKNCGNDIHATNTEGEQVCPICDGSDFESFLIETPPKCSDCRREFSGGYKVPPFYNKKTNTFYCGCRGWD